MIIISITLLAIVGSLSFAWWTGCFTPYNYFTAKRDIRNGKIQLVSYGLPSPELIQEADIRKKYGFSRSNAGCIATTDLIQGISMYNNIVQNYLNKRNGHDWRLRYEREIDSVSKNGMGKVISPPVDVSLK
jgi:hypothetical protein